MFVSGFHDLYYPTILATGYHNKIIICSTMSITKTAVLVCHFMLLKRNRKTMNTCHTDILYFRIPRDYTRYSVHYYYHNFQAWGLPKKLVKEFSAEMETKYLWMSLLLDSILNQFSPFLHILFFTLTLIFSTHLHLGLSNGLFLCSFSMNMHF